MLKIDLAYLDKIKGKNQGKNNKAYFYNITVFRTLEKARKISEN